jgi:hypothetical protein
MEGLPKEVLGQNNCRLGLALSLAQPAHTQLVVSAVFCGCAANCGAKYLRGVHNSKTGIFLALLVAKFFKKHLKKLFIGR